MITISLCMILKDEEKVINRCLDSVVDIVDEIVIIDTGSTDKTKEIASSYTEKIYEFKWIDDFSMARNFSFSKATKDYILWLDADELIDEVNKNKLLSLKKDMSKDIDVITMNTYMDMDENNNPQITARRNRIVRNNKNFKWIGFVHEYINIDKNSKVCDSDIAIIHDKVKCVDDRNLKIYKKNISLGKEMSNRDLYYYGKELYCNNEFDESIKVLEEFIDKAENEEEIMDALCRIGESYLYKKKWAEGRYYLYKTFEYTSPRGEVLYNIALSFQREKKYMQAINWYEIILNIETPTDCSQCLNLCCWRFKPHLNLCACYFKTGDISKAYYHHKKCLEINPLNPCVVSNDEYFKSILKFIKL